MFYAIYELVVVNAVASAITRKQCNKHPNPNLADFLSIMQPMEDKDFDFPNFGAFDFNSLSPSNSFELADLAKHL